MRWKLVETFVLEHIPMGRSTMKRLPPPIRSASAVLLLPTSNIARHPSLVVVTQTGSSEPNLSGWIIVDTDEDTVTAMLQEC